MKKLTKEQLEFLKENFPKVIENAKRDLKIYSETGLYFENGKFYTTAHALVKNVYGSDFVYIGQIKQEDLLTEEEIKKANEELNQCEWF